MWACVLYLCDDEEIFAFTLARIQPFLQSASHRLFSSVHKCGVKMAIPNLQCSLDGLFDFLAVVVGALHVKISHNLRDYSVKRLKGLQYARTYRPHAKSKNWHFLSVWKLKIFVHRSHCKQDVSAVRN